MGLMRFVRIRGRVVWFALIALIALSVVPSAAPEAAASSQPAGTSSFSLQFNSLPSAQGWTYFQGDGIPETSAFSVTGTSLIQHTVGTGIGPGFTPSPNYAMFGVVDGTQPFQLTVRARILSYEGTGPFGFFFAVRTASPKQDYAIGFSPSGVADGNGNGVAIDTTTFHTYVLSATPGGPYTLDIDGHFALGGTFDTSGGALNAVQFGDGNSQFANANAEVTQLDFTQGASADLSLAMTASPNPVAVGSNLIYTITATNDGPSAATGVNVTDILDPSLTFVSATPTAGSCTNASPVMCNLGNLDIGNSATITLVAKPTATGSIPNTATVAGNEPDPNTANNTASTTVTVTQPLRIIFTMPDGTTTDITDTTQPVDVGERIKLAVQASQGLTIQPGSVTWSGPSGQPVPGTTVGMHMKRGTTTSAIFTNDTAKFYWLDSGNQRQIVVTAVLSDGSSASGAATFSVNGPESTTVTSTAGPVTVTFSHIVLTLLDVDCQASGCLVFGNLDSTPDVPGMKFDSASDTSLAPGGTFQWVQIVQSATYSIGLKNGAIKECTIPGLPALDNQFPYAVGPSTSDSPVYDLSTLSTNADSLVRNFSATMYLEWIPSMPHSIPVPLGSVLWQAHGSALRQANTAWSLGPSAGVTANAFTAPDFSSPNFGYPTWTKVISNNARLSCS